MKPVLPENVKLLIKKLNDSGFSAYAVGGCVRDSLLGLAPHDWDICTSAKPEEMKRCFEGMKTFDVGIQHGTIAVHLGGTNFEITTYRIDGDYSDNRRPDSVTFTDDVTLDLSRRDFTVNSMAYSDSEGVIDPFGGEEDLKNNLLRCVGNPDARFGEDALRIMRGLRFSAVYGFEIEAETSRSIHRNRELLNNIAFERIREELMGLICGAFCGRVLNEYRDVISVIIPELSPCFDFEQRTKHHVFDVYEHIVRSVTKVPQEPMLRLVMLLHDVGKPQACTEDKNGTRHFKVHQQISADIAQTVLRRFRFPNAFSEDCIKLIIYHDVRFSGSKRQIKRIMQKLGESRTRDLFQVQRADIFAQSDYLRAEKLAAVDNAEKLFEEIVKDNECFSLKNLAVNGRDLIDSGITDGRKIGRILNALLDEVIDGGVENNREVLLSIAKKMA